MAADGVKMFLKEDMAPAGADKLPVLRAATYLALTGSLSWLSPSFPFSQWIPHGRLSPVAALYLGSP